MSNKLLVLYVFHEYNDRVDWFIKNAIFDEDGTDFIVICNDKKIDFECPSHVKKYFRDNVGYDFGGWSDAILDNSLHEKYDNFIFVNSSAVGPFLPDYFKGRWTDIYINGLENDVKLFGSAINVGPLANVRGRPNRDKELHEGKGVFLQSYIFSMDRETLQYLIEHEIFSKKYYQDHKDVIEHQEILMSRKILKNNWNIGSLVPLFKDIDFRVKEQWHTLYHVDNLALLPYDLMEVKYRNVYWNEYDLVFIKGNRCWPSKNCSVDLESRFKDRDD
jgi:hypothetical protein